ncbi:MAG: sterol desaturase family protein [Planctomycetes bacterium]|nr:sterol desaturase family protein [Planctomycetota bacterium]
MEYLYWLLGISAAFAIAERLRPARPSQPALRPQLANDLFYLVFNGHLWAVLSAGIVTWTATRTREVIQAVDLVPAHGWLDGRPFALQIAVYLVVSDFLQWNVHRLLHTVPWLWQFHKVHHSVHAMDWAANFRFHWMENVVYKSLLFVPIVVWLGGDFAALFWAYVFATAWGHFNHANLDVGIGPLRYVFNSPRMHMWHHDASDEGGVAKNFGIVLSLWDWMFGTAYWPLERAPARIGYPRDEEMPRDVVRQFAFPLARERD